MIEQTDAIFNYIYLMYHVTLNLYLAEAKKGAKNKT